LQGRKKKGFLGAGILKGNNHKRGRGRKSVLKSYKELQER